MVTTVTMRESPERVTHVYLRRTLIIHVKTNVKLQTFGAKMRLTKIIHNLLCIIDLLNQLFHSCHSDSVL